MQPGKPLLAVLEEVLSGGADNVSHLHRWRRHLLGFRGLAVVAEDGQRIQRAGGRTKMSLRNVQINRGLFNIAVPQQHLNGSQVCTVLEQVGSEAMSKGGDVKVFGFWQLGGLVAGPPDDLVGDG